MNDNPLARPVRSLFVAGDSRANIQPGLTALHTVWHREHNWLAKRVLAAMTSAGVLPADPAAADEQIFQLTKKLLIAEFQIVSYDEYLASIVGSGAVPRYSGYKPDINPAVCNEFSTVAFRFGHSQANDEFVFQGRDGLRTKKFHRNFRVPLAEFYFLPAKIMTSGGLDALLRQMPFEVAQEVDAVAVDGVRNLLFGKRSHGGSDLIATNIQRGRDHGIPGYNSMREAYGLSKVHTFEEISSSPGVADKLRELYGSVDDVDALAGGLAEDHVEGTSIGSLFREALVEQFQRTRDGDRFWHERPIDQGGVGAEVAALLASVTTMGSVIVRNVDMTGTTIEQMVRLTDTPGSPRLAVRNMAKRNVMFAPQNPFLSIGGCTENTDCPQDSFCADITKWKAGFGQAAHNVLWSMWCSPCVSCDPWLKAQGLTVGECQVQCASAPADQQRHEDRVQDEL
jgi:hypothetical protein